MTFEADGRTLRVDYVEEGDTLGNVPEAPAKEGHKFIGWQESGVGNVYTGEAIKNIKITQNKLYIAKYEEVASGQHMVRFVVDGTVVHIESVVNNGKLSEVPDNPNVSGYIFRGWQKDGAGKLYSKAELKNLAVKGDLTLVAKLEKEEDIMVPETPDTPKPSEKYARITFAKGEHGTLKGNTVVDVKKNVEVDLSGKAPKVRPAEGWKFTGWSKNLKGKFTEDTTITAQYKKLENIEVPDKPTDQIAEVSPRVLL